MSVSKCNNINQQMRRLLIKSVSYCKNINRFSTEAAMPVVDTKISSIVDQISTLNLLETSQLVDHLKLKLNIKDVAMPMSASMAAPAAADATPEQEKVVEKTSFKVKLEKIDAASKAKIIKEIKGLLPGANLVEAKKFVEGAPKVIKENVPKEEAEKMKKTLEALGATVVLE